MINIILHIPFLSLQGIHALSRNVVLLAFGVQVYEGAFVNNQGVQPILCSLIRFSSW